MIITTITRGGGDTARRAGMMVQERICGNGYKEKHDYFVSSIHGPIIISPISN